MPFDEQEALSLGLAVGKELFTLIPELVDVIQKYRAGKLAADEVKAAADQSYAKVIDRMLHPEADAKATNDAVDVEAAEQFKTPDGASSK